MSDSSSSPSGQIGRLVRDLRDDATALVRQEVALAKAELSEKASQSIDNVTRMAIGGAVAYAGVLVALLGLAALVTTLLIHLGLSADSSEWLARVLLGLIVVAIGWTLIARAKKIISAQNITPTQTQKSLSRDQAWAQEKMESSL
jgi:hypothetical protein